MGLPVGGGRCWVRVVTGMVTAPSDDGTPRQQLGSDNNSTPVSHPASSWVSSLFSIAPPRASLYTALFAL